MEAALRPQHIATITLSPLLPVGCFTAAPPLAGAPLFAPTEEAGLNSAPESPGPTLCLDYGRGESPGYPVAEFTYFVPPIAVEQEGSDALGYFGLAPALEGPVFTFPCANKLKTGG